MNRSARSIKRIDKNDFLAISHGLGLGKPIARSLLKADHLWQARSNPRNPFNSTSGSERHAPATVQGGLSRTGGLTQPNSKVVKGKEVQFISPSRWKLRQLWQMRGADHGGGPRPKAARDLKPSVWARVAAISSDLLVVASLLLAMVYLVGSLQYHDFNLGQIIENLQSLPLAPSPLRMAALGLITLYVIYLGYFGVFRWLVGCTPGQKIFTMRIVKTKTLDDQRLAKEIG